MHDILLCYRQLISDLANSLFLFVLRPNHIVHLIQALSSLFVCLQLHLAVHEGGLGKQNINVIGIFFRLGEV